LIIDDCANLADSKKKVSELCHLAFSGRHYLFTIWLINQKYNSVVKEYRENIRMLVLFYNKDEISIKQALEENDIVPKEKRMEIIEKLKDKKGSKLILRLQHPFEYIIIT
jgi:ribonuclease HIII